MTKKITIVSTRLSAPVVFDSEAVTLADLKKEMHTRKINFDGMAIVEKQTRNTLELPEALLCSGDCTIFLAAKKIKSGAAKKEVKPATKAKAKPAAKAKAKAKSAKKEEPKKAVKKAVAKPIAKKEVKKAVVKKTATPKAKPAEAVKTSKVDNSAANLLKEAQEIERKVKNL